MKKIISVVLAALILLGQNTYVFAEEKNFDYQSQTGIDNQKIENNSKESINLEDSSISEDTQDESIIDETEKIDISNITYDNFESSSSNGVTLTVEWNNPILGQSTNFHVSATGGSGSYIFRMDAPSYSNPDEWSFESVADPSRGEWMNYTETCSSHDYNFMMTASGTYNFRFYVMDKNAGIYYLRVSINIQVSDEKYPSVNSIVNMAVSQCNNESDGTEYQKALWLHDWLLERLDYDASLKWSSSESALTRGLGTCQAYESAYSKLLTAAGIDNTETRDTYDGHTWNALKIDGEWYQVDCTWDDSKDDWYNFDQRHLYFGLTDELMALAHPGHSKIYLNDGYMTPSTHLDNNYFVKNGEASAWAEGYRERIQIQLDAQKTKFIIDADNASYPPSISGIQNGIIAYILSQNKWKTANQNVELQVTGDATELKFTATYSATEPEKDNVQSELDKLAENNINIIEDGVYEISSASNNAYVLDVKRASDEDKTNVQLYTNYGNPNQKWIVSHDEKGYVIIKNVNSKKALTIESANNKELVYQLKYKELDEQKWIVTKLDKGYQIHSAKDFAYVLDLKNGKVNNGTSIQVYQNYTNEAQVWNFIETEESVYDKLAMQNKSVIKDGTYAISIATEDSQVLDVKRASNEDKASVQIYMNYGNPNQKWIIAHDEKGYVIIKNVNSNKVLTIDKAINKELVYQSEYRELDSQKWIIVKKDKGYQIHSAVDFEYVLDLKGGKIDNSTLIQIYQNYTNEAQIWKFQSV